MRFRAVVLFLGFFLCGCAEKAAPPETAVPYELVLQSSIMQLVDAAVDPVACPSGWTLLVDELWEKGEGHLPPLQQWYVNRFDTLSEFHAALIAAAKRFGTLHPRLRLSLAWPCWMANENWRKQMMAMISDLVEQDVPLEIVLSHHDSYPAALHTSKSVPEYQGWAHDEAVSRFISYTESVVDELGPILPKDTRFYPVFEPVNMILASHMGFGNWPPGGKLAVASFMRALQHMREAHLLAGDLIADAGWIPMANHNIRPFQSSIGTTRPATPDERMVYMANQWWLLAVLRGCVDDTFDGIDDVTGIFCDEQTIPTPFLALGMTYYGPIYTTGGEVDLPTPDGEWVTITVPHIDVYPHPPAFGKALVEVATAYPDVELHVAEIGFSSGEVEKQEELLRAYLGFICGPHQVSDKCVPVSSVGIHGVFQSAEFEAGEWYFHLVDSCLDGECTLTPWGEAFEQIFLSP